LDVESQTKLAVEKLRMESEIKRLEKELSEMRDLTEILERHKTG
jgi:transposase-like protein